MCKFKSGRVFMEKLTTSNETVCRAALSWANGAYNAKQIREAVDFLRAYVADMDEGPARDAGEIMQAIIEVQRQNCADMISDPDGPYPACKNKLGTFICETCGRDVRGKTDACPSSPRDSRWRFIAR